MPYEDIDLEPASALATKISRAHDNPSPPPNMQPLDVPIFPAPTDHRPQSNSPVPNALDSDIADGRAPTSVPSPASHEHIMPLDPGLAASPLANSSTDLIAFDDDHLPDVPRVAVRYYSCTCNLSS